MKRKIIAAGLLLVAAVVVIFVFTPREEKDEVRVEKFAKAKKTPAKKRLSSVKQSVRPALKTRKAEFSRTRYGSMCRNRLKADLLDDDEHPYSARDKQVAKALEDALDEFHEKEGGVSAKAAKRKLFEAAAVAAQSANPSVRERAIDAYSALDSEALPELTPMMADPDAHVAECAIDAVDQSLLTVKSPQLRFETAAAYMNTFTVNEDALAMLSGTMASAALDVVDAADDSPGEIQRARDDRNRVVEVLAAIIESGSDKTVEVAKETYSDITSEDWIGRGAAMEWANNLDGHVVSGQQ